MARRALRVHPHPQRERRPGARRRRARGRGLGARLRPEGRAERPSSSTEGAGAARDRGDPRLVRRRRRADRDPATGTSTSSRRRRSSSGTRRRSSSRRSASGSSRAASPTTRGSSSAAQGGAASSPRPATLPVNLRFCCDGEEEIGGHSIVDFLAEDERGADAAVIFDSGMIRRGMPGVQHRHARARVLPRHACAPARATCTPACTAAPRSTRRTRSCRRSAASSPRDGRLAEPLRAGVVPPTERGARRLGNARRRATTSSPTRARGRPIRGGRRVLPAHVRRAGARRQRRSRAARRSSRRRCCRSRPSRTCRSGWRPARRSDAIGPEVERLLREAAPAGAERRDRALVVVAAGAVPPDAQAIRSALDGFEQRLRPPAALIRSGGTLPIVPALADKGIPTIITGFGLPESNIHSPNERAARRLRAARASTPRASLLSGVRPRCG